MLLRSFLSLTIVYSRSLKPTLKKLYSRKKNIRKQNSPPTMSESHSAVKLFIGDGECCIIVFYF